MKTSFGPITTLFSIDPSVMPFILVKGMIAEV